MMKETSANLKSLQCATASWWLLHVLDQVTFLSWAKTLKSCFSTLRWTALARVWPSHQMRSTCSLLETKLKSTSGISEAGSVWDVSRTQVASTQQKLPLVPMDSFLPLAPKWAQSTCFTSQRRLNYSKIVLLSRLWTWRPLSLICSSTTRVKCSPCAPSGKKTLLDLRISHLTLSSKTSPEWPQVF